MSVRLSPKQYKEIRDLITPEDLEEMKYAHFNVILREQRQRSHFWHYFATEEQKEQRKRENYKWISQSPYHSYSRKIPCSRPR